MFSIKPFSVPSQPFPPPNMLAGMEVTSAHWEQLTQFCWSLQGLYGRLALDGAYGLLYDPGTDQAGLDLLIEGQFLLINRLFALNSEGLLLLHDVAYMPAVRLDLQAHDKGNYDLLVKIVMGEKTAFGEPGPDHFRPPWCVPKLVFSLVQAGSYEISEFPHSIKLAELRVEDHTYSLNEAYIPPCLHIGAHRALRTAWMELPNLMDHFQLCLEEILKKTRNQLKQPVLRSLHHLADSLARYCIEHRFEMRDMSPETNPRDMVRWFSGIAGRIYHFLTLDIEEAAVVNLLKQHFENRVGLKHLDREDIIQYSELMRNLRFASNDLTAINTHLQSFIEHVLRPFQYLAKANPIMVGGTESGRVSTKW